MTVPNPFLLESYVPYEIHNDYKWIEASDDEIPFYLIIIPVSTGQAKTIIFNQHGNGEYLHFVDYKKDHQPVPDNERLSEEEYQKYFSHCWPQERHYISINKVFDWEVGSVLLCDMRYFHASDNFLTNDITQKSCITLMTKTKKDKFLEISEQMVDNTSN